MRNVEPSSDIPRFGAATSVDEIADAIKQHGCAVIESLVSPQACDAILDEMRPWVDASPYGPDEFSGHTTKRTGALLARSPSSAALVAHQVVLDVVDRVLWPKKTSFQLHLTQVITIEPGAPAQQLHRDQWCFDFFPFPDDVEVEVGTMWALTDFTDENGATRIAVGSHRATDPRAVTPDDTVAAAMPRGSVVLYSGRAVHGGGANRSAVTRVGLNIDYALSWLRQEENQYLSVSFEVARELPERVQRLMGYSIGAYALGYVDDLRDPLTVLRGDSSAIAGFAPSDA
jgi:ectoine hydroxylase-related dioxygenase (phytanoyl-CoA dioxygenase family)